MPVGVYQRRQPSEAQIVARFWSKVSKSDGCWTWQAATSRRGYGAFGIGRRVVAAHRLSWALHNGPIPDGMMVCHTCDNPACCSPAHLFLGTNTDNVRDMHAKGRARGLFQLQARCAKGHELTPENSARHSNGKNRRCRTCRREDLRAWRARRKERAA